MTILEDYFTVEFTNIKTQNMFFFQEILDNLNIKIIKAKTNSLVCQHQDYNTLLFAIRLYLNSLEKRLKLKELL